MRVSRCRRITLLGPRLRLPTSADFSSDVRFALASVRSSTMRATEVDSAYLRGRKRPSGPEPASDGTRRAIGEAMRACLPRSTPGTRVAGPTERERCKRSRHAVPAKILLGVVSRKTVPSRGPRCLRSRRNPRSVGRANPGLRSSNREPVTPPPKRRCLQAPTPFLPPRAPPLSDDASGRGGSASRCLGGQDPRGATCRSARHDFYDRISSRGDVPRTS